jgi:uncharacterized integral membrane protein (TIGR00698 family)
MRCLTRNIYSLTKTSNSLFELSTSINRISRALPGLIYCIGIATVSFLLWSVFKPISPLMWAFLSSILIANILGLRESMSEGISFSSGQLLRFTVSVLGFTTSALIWVRVGVGVIAAFLVITVALAMSLLLGRKIGLNIRISALIGIGTAICGASAIAALSPAIDAKDEESGLAVSSITLYGLISMFLYPILFLYTPVGSWLGNNPNVFAVWTGAGIHETAQVIAAAGVIGQEIVAAAMLIKAVRIFMIGPVVFLLSYICCRFEKNEGRVRNFVVPLFAVAFVLGSLVCAMLDLNVSSLLMMGFDWVNVKTLLSGTVLPFMFATAFAGVGSKVRFKSIMSLGYKPIILAATVAVTAGLLAFLVAFLLVPFIPV